GFVVLGGTDFREVGRQRIEQALAAVERRPVVRQVGEVPRIELVVGIVGAEEFVRVAGSVDEIIVLFQLAENLVHPRGFFRNKQHGDGRHGSMASSAPRKRLGRQRRRCSGNQNSKRSSPHFSLLAWSTMARSNLRLQGARTLNLPCMPRVSQTA